MIAVVDSVTVPPEVLGPLGLTAFLLIVVALGARWMLAFVKEVIADLRRERDDANVRARESDEALQELAKAVSELVAEVRQIADGVRDGSVTVKPRR